MCFVANKKHDFVMRAEGNRIQKTKEISENKIKTQRLTKMYNFAILKTHI
jgi:hypothetical protein